MTDFSIKCTGLLPLLIPRGPEVLLYLELLMYGFPTSREKS